MTKLENKDQTLDALKTLEGTALLGIDGMIDEVWEILASRTSATEFTKMTKMIEFGSAITERQTGGIAKERILKRRMSGGFVGNTGRAVATLGAKTTLLGYFGLPNIDPLFHEFDHLATLVSINQPATINLFEFDDGKIMMPNLEHLLNLHWTDVVDTLGQDRVDELMNVDVVGVGYWSNLYDFEAILHGIVDASLKGGRTKRVFHDFANLNKRTPEALKVALAALKTENERIPQTLSLNEHEGAILAASFGIYYPQDVNNVASAQAVFEAVCKMRTLIDIDELIVHTGYYAALSTATQGDALAYQNHCDAPVKTTGAGDTFNGGYMASCLTPLSAHDRLVCANATTYYYVSTGTPPTKEKLVETLAQFEAK